MYMLFRLQLILVILTGYLYSCASRRLYITGWGACSDCGYHGYSYQWCKLGRKVSDWDYCSTTPGYSTREHKCSNNCDYHGSSHRWCTLEKGGWDYCSLIEDHSATYFTRWNEECQNYCDIESNGEYQCRTTDNVNQQCSLVKDLTAAGAPCKALANSESSGEENSCGNHGKKYLWCWTEGSWYYCSNPSKSPAYFGTIARSGREKRSNRPSWTLTRIQTTDQLRRGNRRLRTYVAYEEPNPSAILSRANQHQDHRLDAYALILRWHNRHEVGSVTADNEASHIVREPSGSTIRLDRQRQVIRNGVVFVNFQLQINGRNVPRPSTIAAVFIEIGLVGEELRGLEDMDERAIRRHVVTALMTSLRHSARVWVWQDQVEIENRNGTEIVRIIPRRQP